MKKNKITVIEGAGKIQTPGSIEVTDAAGKTTTLLCTSIIIATGASPRKIPAFAVDGKNIITYRQALELPVQPKKMLVIGSGAIGTEFSYFFNCLGTEVHVAEMLPTMVPVEDEEVGQQLEKSFTKQGIHVYTSAKIEKTEVVKDGEVACRIIKKDGEALDLTVDLVLVAVGMVPNTADLGLEANGVKLNEKGFIEINEFQQTTVKNIYAIGDVAGRQLLAHKASAEAEVAVAHAIGHAVAGVNYGQIPGCTYCFPQIASVGLTEKACKEKGLKVKIGRFPFQASGKARAIGHTDGFVKLIYGEEHGELLGAHMIGPDVTEMLAELGLALKLEATWEEIGFTVHAHPTLSESVMEATWDSQGACVHT